MDTENNYKILSFLRDLGKDTDGELRLLMFGAANALERTTNERDDLKQRIATLEQDNRMLGDKLRGLERELSSFQANE